MVLIVLPPLFQLIVYPTAVYSKIETAYNKEDERFDCN